jgi:protease-4
MKEFFRSVLASLVALCLFAGGILVVVVGVSLAVSAGKPVVAPRSVLILNLSTSFPESAQDPDPTGLAQRLLTGGGQVDALPLAGVLQALDRAAKDRSISALYLTGHVMVQGYSSGPAAQKELREAILRFKAESGKPVIAYNDSWDKLEYYLCAGASRLYGNPSGEVEMTGLAVEPMFFGSALKKLGIEVQVTREGKYKSAVEPYILDKMSDANREQLTALLGDLWEEWKDAVAADRHLAPADIQHLADDKGMLSAAEAQKDGLLDKLVSADEVLDELKDLSGARNADLEFPQVDMDAYIRMAPPSTSKNRIALAFAEGEIVDGHGLPGQVGGERLSRELRRLRLDPQVKAIVLRVNSPGGSAMASEVIQREIILARKVKPVVVSMGHLAASGGYWISTYGDHIFAEPNSITGSIGVYGLLPNVQKLANDHGVSWDMVQTARMADLTSITRPKNDAELARIRSMVDDIYGQFLARVSASRGLSLEQTEAIAQGRVWSGRQALKIGLVDELGGIQDAIRYAAKRAGVAGDYQVEGPVEPPTPVERLLKLLGGSEGGGFSQSRLGPERELMGALVRILAPLRALNDPDGIYARMPFDLDLR